MKDFNKDMFNDSIRNKFSNAEVQPGNNVWEGIEAELLKQDNRRMQKKAAFYRNLAAAVIFIALISIYFNLQDFNFGTSQESAFAPIEIDSRTGQEFLNENDIVFKSPEVSKRQGAESAKTGVKNLLANSSIYDSESVEKNNGVIISDIESENIALISAGKDLNATLNKMDIRAPKGLEFRTLEVDVNEVSYFAVSALEQAKGGSELAWNTNVNVGSGNFNPNSEITETPVFSTVNTLNNAGTNARSLGDNASSNTNQERETVEALSSAPMQGNISFTFGVNLGAQINEKWSFKSGLQYGAYRSTSSSSTVLRDRNSDKLFPYHGASSSTEIADGRVINVTSEYELYNDFQIITIPLMVSYKIIDRKFDVAVVAGASADFMLSNTLKGGSDQINDVRFDQNDKQSYKNFFASSMAGIEISYPFADRYAVSIMPTYKKALSNITTENATFNSMPAFMGLNMSLAYSF